MHAYRATLKKGKIEFIEPIPDFEEAEVCILVLNSGSGNLAAGNVLPTDNRLAGVVVNPGPDDPISHAALIEWMNLESDETNWEEAFNVGRG